MKIKTYYIMRKLLIILTLLFIGITGYTQTIFRTEKYSEWQKNEKGTWDEGDFMYEKRQFIFTNDNLYIRDPDKENYVWSKNAWATTVGRWYISREEENGDVEIRFLRSKDDYPFISIVYNDPEVNDVYKIVYWYSDEWAYVYYTDK